MTEDERIEVLFELYTKLENDNFKSTPSERMVLESIYNHKYNRGSITYIFPLLIYKNLIFSQNFLKHFFGQNFMLDLKEMVEFKDPLEYIKYHKLNK